MCDTTLVSPSPHHHSTLTFSFLDWFSFLNKDLCSCCAAQVKNGNLQHQGKILFSCSQFLELHKTNSIFILTLKVRYACCLNEFKRNGHNSLNYSNRVGNLLQNYLQGTSFGQSSSLAGSVEGGSLRNRSPVSWILVCLPKITSEKCRIWTAPRLENVFKYKC